MLVFLPSSMPFASLSPSRTLPPSSSSTITTASPPDPLPSPSPSPSPSPLPSPSPPPPSSLSHQIKGVVGTQWPKTDPEEREIPLVADHEVNGFSVPTFGSVSIASSSEPVSESEPLSAWAVWAVMPGSEIKA
eukprot:2881752-Rhodomonas_salina.3